MTRFDGAIRLSREDLEWFMENEGKRIEFAGKDYIPMFESGTDGVLGLVAYDIHDNRYEFDVV